MARNTKTKITVHVPSVLLKQAKAATGRGITETVRDGLQLLAATNAYEGLLRLRGKVHLNLDLKELREDRD
jgi:hypothetical protein